jgi:hypothetical protein
MHQVQSLLDEIRDELSTDVYYIYTDKRYFLLETIAVSLATACLLEYFKGLLGPREAGEAHRQYIRDFVGLVRNDDVISIKAEMEVLEKQASVILRTARPDATDEREKIAVESLKAALTQMGMPSTQAEVHSENIAALVKDYLNPRGKE